MERITYMLQILYFFKIIISYSFVLFNTWKRIFTSNQSCYWQN